MGTENADDRSKRVTASSRRRLPGGRNASPWSRRFVLGAILAVVLLAPLWIDPLTLATIRGSEASLSPGAADTIAPLDSGPKPTDDPSLIWTGIAADSFTRTAADGWGAAETGGQWQPFGAPASLSVANDSGAGEAGAQALSLVALDAAIAHDTKVAFNVTIPQQPAGTELVAGAVLRRTADGSGYLAELRVSADGKVSVGAEVFDATGAHALSVPIVLEQLTTTPGTVLRVRAQSTGIDPTTIRVRVWPAIAPEPNFWQYSVVDWTGVLQHDGRPGVGWQLVATSASASPDTTTVPITIDNFEALSADTGANQ